MGFYSDADLDFISSKYLDGKLVKVDLHTKDVLLQKDAEFHRLQELILKMKYHEEKDTMDPSSRRGGSRSSHPDNTKSAEHGGADSPKQDAEKERQKKAQNLANHIEELTNDLRRRRAGLEIIRRLEARRRPPLALLDPSIY